MTSGRQTGAVYAWLCLLARAAAATPLLDFSCAPAQPAWSSSDTWGALVVTAKTSNTTGTPYNASVYVQSPGYLDLNMTYDQYLPFTDVLVDATLASGERLVVGQNASLNTPTTLAFALAALPPRAAPYTVHCYAASIDGQQAWNQTTQFRVEGAASRAVAARDMFAPPPPPPPPLRPRAQIAGEDVWCGKPYRAGAAQIAVDGQFPVPARGQVPRLHLGCRPRVQPYLHGERQGSFVVATSVRYDVGVPVDAGLAAVAVHVAVAAGASNATGATTLLAFAPGLNETHDVAFDLAALPPRDTPYAAVCTATAPNGTVLDRVAEELWVLPPNPHGGAAVKQDRLTGALLVPEARANGTAAYAPLFGTGFYAGFSWWLSLDVAAIMDSLAAAGYNIVHPVGTNTNDTAMRLIFEKAAELGMWVIPGLATDAAQSAAGNNSYLTAQIEQWRGYGSLLFYYTFDEPDGQVIPRNASALAKAAVRGADALYHPVGTVLNCADYFFADYAAGADIISHDVYAVAVNTTWSVQYDTACTASYGCCGCDNCAGRFEDVADRLDAFRERLAWLRSGQLLWSVPQAFGSETFWARYPTPAEVRVQYALSVNHGARGLEAWDAPSTPAILAAAGAFARRFTHLKTFIFGVPVAGVRTSAGRVDVAAWTEGVPVTGAVRGREALLIVVNMNIAPVAPVVVELGELAAGANATARDLYDGRDVQVAEGRVSLDLEGLGVAFIAVAL